MKKLPRIPAPPSAVFRELRITVLPFVAFAVVLGLTVVTWRGYVGPSQIVGEIASKRSVITAIENGTVQRLHVQLFERVTNGQVIATISPGGTRAQSLQLAISRARESFQRDAIGNSLRFERNRYTQTLITLNWLDQFAELGSLKAQRAYFESELKRQELLAKDRALGSNIASVAEYEIAKRDYDSLIAQIEERDKLVSVLNEIIVRETSSSAELDTLIKKALADASAAEDRELLALDTQGASVVLIAPIDGVVSDILKGTNENVVTGEPILILSGNHPDHVRCFVRQPLNLDVHVDMPLEIRCRSKGHESGIGRVIAVGTQLEPILPQLLLPGRTSNTVEYGLPFLVSLPRGLPVFGGEMVDLRAFSD